MSADQFSRKLCLLLCLAIFGGLMAFDSAVGQERQRRGRGDPSSLLTAYRDDVFGPTLKLSADQTSKLEALRMEAMGIRRRLSRDGEEWIKASKEFEERAVNILTDEQKEIWQKRKAEVVAELAKNEQPVAEKPAGTDTTARPATAAKSATGGSSGTGGTVTDTNPAAQTVSQPAIVEKPPEGAITVISFGDAARAKAAEADAKPAAESGAGTKDQGKTLTFNFQYAPWADVLKLFAEVNGLSLDLNEVPPGTFSYYDDKSHSMTEALDVINGLLLSKGYCLVRRDRFLVCVNLSEPVPPSVIPNVTESELPQRGKYELLSLVLPLPNTMNAEKMVTEVTALLGPQGKANAMKSTNSLILTDIGSHLRRVSELLGKSQPIDDRENAFKAITLKHIQALDAERIVRRHFNLNPVTTTTTMQPGFGGFGGRGFGGNNGGFGGGRGGFGGGGFGGGGFGGGGFGNGGFGGGGNNNGQGGQGGPQPQQVMAPQQNAAASPFLGKIQVTADTHLNKLLVTASATLLKVVEEFVTSIDSNVGQDGKEITPKTEPVLFQGYSVSGNDVTAMSQMLNNVVPGVIVGEDTRSGKIYVYGTREEHEKIKDLLKSSSDTSSTTRVFQLTKLDPQQVAGSLKRMFENDATRPSIEADATQRKIMVRGTADHLNQVQSMLENLGAIAPQGDGDGFAGAGSDRGTIRKLDLQGHDPDEIRELIEKYWNADQNRSPIRVVVPSRPGSPIRDRRVPTAQPPLNQPTNSGTVPNPPARRDASSADATIPGDRPPMIRIDGRRNNGDAQEEKPVSRHRSAMTQIYPRRVQAIQTSQSSTTDETRLDGDADRAASLKVTSELQPEEKVPEPEPVAEPEARVQELPPEIKAEPSRLVAAVDSTSSKPPIGANVIGNELILTSPDTKALDELEAMVSSLLQSIPQRTKWTVFYLVTADATEAAKMIESLFPQSSVTSSATSNDSFMGFGGFGNFGRNLANATGLNQTLGGSQGLKIITDVRANALFVTGPRDVIRDIEYVLELLDTPTVPGSLRDRQPRTIAVEYADVDEVATMIEDVFKDSMTPEPAQPMQGMNPFQAMFQGGGNRGAGGNNGNRRTGTELTLSVDKRTSHIIVSCNDTMFRRIEAMVQSIDQRAKDANRTVRIVELKTADPIMMESTLSSLFPKITVGGTRPTKRPDAAPAAGQQSQQQNNQWSQQRMQQGGNGMSRQFGGGGNTGGNRNAGGGNNRGTGGGGNNRGGGNNGGNRNR